MPDGSNETDKFDVERKSCDPGLARALETRRKSTQCSRATRHHRIWLLATIQLAFRGRIGPHRFHHPTACIQPLWSGPEVDDIQPDSTLHKTTGGIPCEGLRDAGFVAAAVALEGFAVVRFGAVAVAVAAGPAAAVRVRRRARRRTRGRTR